MNTLDLNIFMKIYTKTGDKGETGLLSGGRVSKDSLRITSYGAVDELNAVLGWIGSDYMANPVLDAASQASISDFIVSIQRELFSIGASLATLPTAGKNLEDPVSENSISAIEKRIDDWEKDLKPLHNFILPGGGPYSAKWHIARTVARRAESAVVALSQKESIASLVVPYLNRLSDAFFVLSRWVSLKAEEKENLWKKVEKKGA